LHHHRRLDFLKLVARNQGYSNPNQAPENQSASAINNRNLLLGNPSNAVPSVASIDNYLMVKPQYVLSYNSKTNTANWVSWQLNRSWIGTADRLDNFRPDDALPAEAYKVRPTDYTGSGYDRGHIARECRSHSQ
jgi:endonuclease G